MRNPPPLPITPVFFLQTCFMIFPFYNFKIQQFPWKLFKAHFEHLIYWHFKLLKIYKVPQSVTRVRAKISNHKLLSEQKRNKYEKSSFVRVFCALCENHLYLHKNSLKFQQSIDLNFIRQWLCVLPT